MMLTHSPDGSRSDLLRWYLLLWLCLISLWGLFEIAGGTVSAAWSACSTGGESPDICAQLKQHLGPQGQPDMGTLPPTVLTALLLRAIIVFSLLLVLYGLLLWFSLSGEKKGSWTWAALCFQGLLACLGGFFLPALSVIVPVSLLLVLILETCAVFKRVRTILAFSGTVTMLFLLTVVLSWRQGYAFSDRSLNIIVALVLLMGSFLFVGGFFILYTRLVQMHTTITTAYDRLAAASTRIEELTLMMERQRMARELHDTLAQGLAGIILQLGVVYARAREHHDEEVQEILAQTLASARETLAKARKAIDDLRAETPIDPVEAVQEEIRRFTLLSGLPCVTELDQLSQASSAHVEQISGVISESLANVARHAHAQHAWVRVSRERQALCLEIGDDGIGFDPARTLRQPGHYGLPGLRERAHLMGGQLTILSAPGQGTRIQFHWPLASCLRESTKGAASDE